MEVLLRNCQILLHLFFPKCHLVLHQEYFLQLYRIRVLKRGSGGILYFLGFLWESLVRIVSLIISKGQKLKRQSL